MFPFNRDEQPETTIQIEVPASLFAALKDAVAGKAIPSLRRRELAERLLYAREVDVIEAHLDFAELEREAKRQGCSAVDILWDRAGRTREPG